MGEIGLGERFARFEAEVPATFRPAPLAEVVAAARRRRRLRRALFAGVLALLLGGPAGAVAVAGRHDGRPSPMPLPSVQTAPPSASVSPDPIHPVDRKVTVPGVDLPLRAVQVIDAGHAWAFYDSCPDGGDPGGCRYALGSTSDGGVTWHRANLPDLAADGQLVVGLFPLDERSAVFYVLHKRFWLTTDGGATFTSYPASSPPPQAQRAITYPPSGFRLLCPGATGFEDGASGIECDRQRMVRVGSGPVPNQPTLPGRLDAAFQAADGRIWLQSSDGDLTRVAVSTDDSRTWTDVGSVPGNATLSVSPDGAEVWLVENHSPDVPAAVWRLTGSRFMPQAGIPYDFSGGAGGGGMLAGVTGDAGKVGQAGLWYGGTFHPIPGLSAMALDVLPDGSLTSRLPDGSTLVGTGTGTDRDWYRLS
jgi:hypothetical protein